MIGGVLQIAWPTEATASASIVPEVEEGGLREAVGGVARGEEAEVHARVDDLDGRVAEPALHQVVAGAPGVSVAWL